MKSGPPFPLLAKVLAWLVLHLLILAFSFFLFVRWQLGMGLDSLIVGSAGERLMDFGDEVSLAIVKVPPREWAEVIDPIAKSRKVTAGVLGAAGEEWMDVEVPSRVRERARAALPPARNPAGLPGRPRGRDGLGMGRERRPMRPGAEDEAFGPLPFDENLDDGNSSENRVYSPKSRPAFLMRADDGSGYWAGVLLHLPPTRGLPGRVVMLLVRSDRLDGSGMFFDYKPWLFGGLAVLSLSIAFWTPFVWSITKYVRRLTSATDDIASGRFQVNIPARGNDELGKLGRAIETMADRLDHLVSGQKRFLGDAAHELCAPLARIRTGLGIMEMKLHGADNDALASIESDTAELAALVNEILAFSKAGNRAPARQTFELAPLVQQVLARESADVEAELQIPDGLRVWSDPTLLGRAIGNLVRNASIHAGPRPRVVIAAEEDVRGVRITVSDNGPGVPPEELARIFEPFYRIDRSRSRDTGGSGLGLAIVRTAIEACGGETSASLPENGGFSVKISLPKGE
jgi:two-component system sensor histidine kinase CpxA